MNDKIFEIIDELFEQSPKAAEEYMVTALEESLRSNKREVALKLYNELIGYYRQTSEKERLLEMFDGVLKLLALMGAEDTISYATTTLNIANGYRSIGMLEEAKDYYTKTQNIYAEAIAENRLSKWDMCVAGLYNNMSLLYQELADYREAESLLKKALEIVTHRQEKFEIAVTYANLANTMLLCRDYDQAYRYAQEAITRFKARNYKDAHYCAALSAMASCYYEWGESSRAKALFVQAMNIVENTIGRNSQYKRLEESIKMCEDNKRNEGFITGLELSRQYFETYGKTMLEKNFSEYMDKITVGVVGEGSDCYGFDDEFSTDHDFGPGFCIFVDDEVDDEIVAKLGTAYESLPKEYMGYKTQETVMGQGRRGVIRTSEFYQKHLGGAEYSCIDFKKLQDYELAVCTNGQIFYGAETDFIKMREALSAGYPASVRLLKMSEDVAKFSQTGQYNYKRMLQREDDFTAELMLADFCKAGMILYHHFMDTYPCHDKWLKASTLRLQEGEVLVGLLEKVTNMIKIGEPLKDVLAAIDEVGAFLAAAMYEKGDISDIDVYLANHVSELMFKASVVELTKEELVERIVRLEFKAFDEVKNEGGRASCQDDWPTFSVMRKAQYLVWNKEMLVQYYYDFSREYELGHNLITEKYGRMMESTAPLQYKELKLHFPKLSEEKKAIIDQIVALQVGMTEEFGKDNPDIIERARSIHSYEDNYNNTSSETYLRGEISTYSDKMLQLYAAFVVDCVKNGINITEVTIGNIDKSI